MEEGKGGRPTVYSAEIAKAICELIAESKTLNQACEALDGVVNRRTVIRWLGEHEEFRHQYAHAHEMQADHDADQVREIMRRVIDPTVPDEQRLTHQDARLAIDALKWAAGKRNPKKYGDKVTTTLEGNPDNPVQVTGKIEMVIVDPDAKG